MWGSPFAPGREGDALLPRPSWGDSPAWGASIGWLDRHGAGRAVLEATPDERVPTLDPCSPPVPAVGSGGDRVHLGHVMSSFCEALNVTHGGCTYRESGSRTECAPRLLLPPRGPGDGVHACISAGLSDCCSAGAHDNCSCTWWTCQPLLPGVGGGGDRTQSMLGLNSVPSGTSVDVLLVWHRVLP